MSRKSSHGAAHQSAVDRLYMSAALRLAERGMFSVTRGNPRVGCLLVKNHSVVGRGWHRTDGEAHAEVDALADAGDHAKGSTAYVTLEPCCFEGRTPACTDTLAQHGIRRVVIGSRDPHPKVRGQGIERLKELDVDVKVMGLPMGGHLNPGILMRHRQNRPYVRIKTALSIDGRTAMASGESQWITCDEARRDAQYWRARSGAIVTGIGTVLADDPRLTVRAEEFKPSQPWRVVLDSQGRFPSAAKMVDEPGRTLVVCGRDAHGVELTDRVDVWHEHTARIDIASVLRRLADEGVNEVLVEAGSELVGGFINCGRWDEMIAYVAPKLMGTSARPVAEVKVSEMTEAIPATVSSVEEIGADLRVVLHRATRHA